MIAVDTSALMAIVLNEPERDAFIAVIEDAECVFVSSSTLIETRLVAFRRGGEELLRLVDGVVELLGLALAPACPGEIEAAHAAFVAYGKGSGHPAQLNLGDLFSYALAKVRNMCRCCSKATISATPISNLRSCRGAIQVRRTQPMRRFKMLVFSQPFPCRRG